MSINYKAFLLAIIFGILLCSSFYPINLIAGYLDEVFILLLLFVVFKDACQTKKISSIWVLIILFILYTIITSLGSSYYRGLLLTVIDLFLFLKPVFLLLGFIRISYKVRSKFIDYIYFPTSIYIYAAFILYFVNIIFNIFPSFDSRFGLNSYSFITENPGEFLNVVILLGTIILISPKRRDHSFKLFIIAFLIFSTLRIKGIVMLSFAVLIFLYAKRNNIKEIFINGLLSKSNFSSKLGMLIISMLALIPGFHQFKSYFLSEMTPRLLLIVKSYELASENFPFGVGAGTYGSAVARMWYSPVYTEFGFYNYYGLSGDSEVNFLNDNFWPMVFAQYGFIGAFLIILIYKSLLSDISNNLVQRKYMFEVYLVIMISLILSTLGSAILIGYIGCLYLMLLGSMVKK